MAEHDNLGFSPSSDDIEASKAPTRAASISSAAEKTECNEDTPKRDNWDNDLEFLMSCIALSVGLGNVWRFPFIALDNGGGAFLIPYIIVLILVGKPIYYLEMIMGQFASRGTLTIFDYSPIMRGIGYGQALAAFYISSYYASLMSLTLRYLVTSFYATLPWSYCREEWGDMCIDSKLKDDKSLRLLTKDDTQGVKKTSAEFYFINIVLREKPNIDDGIGVPSWSLSITLVVSWILVAIIVMRGIKSSGKASYFLAIFPYVIMLILLVRSLTLPGAFDGVLYFLKPQWDKLLDANVWYAAVTQVFFSLSVCYGIIIMYASFNRFRHTINRDCNIVTTLDTFTSLLSGVVIFGILGNLAYESNNSDIRSVVQGGPGLAFISYPDAIAKFKVVPQVFSALFFLMMYILGIGTNVGVISSIITLFCDRFPSVPRWPIVIVICMSSCCVGLVYLTPGGQYILNFLDFYGVTFVAIVLAIFELIALGWIYGVKNVCRDIKFMLGRETSWYYRICWSIVTPLFIAVIFIYMLVQYEPLEYNGVQYPDELYAFGWCISAIGIGQLIIWSCYTVYQRPEHSFSQRFYNAFKPLDDWGPLDPKTLKEYKQYVQECNELNSSNHKKGFWFKVYDNIFG